ncbi:Na+/H+ antiporter NhaC family protein [Clostridium sp.]|uniref:Na+/H+ antiporter NhaC family protein n=1 Tax=Clostridium sp. TaxID=1506 RepID=UPI002FC6ED4A
MDVILGLVLSASILIFSVAKGIDILIPLSIVLTIFVLLGIKRGLTLKETLSMAYKGGKKSFIVLQIFILIGAIISSWMASGTVPAIVYYGVNLINSSYFVISAFILSSLVSMLIGTSFGTIGTVGISLMVMARAGGGDLFVIAGAILSGAYFGDRCSPMSSSANLVANITDTEIYKNIKNMIVSSVIPFIVASLIYTLLSLKQPLDYSNSNIIKEITYYFKIDIIVLIPAIIIMVLSIFKVTVKTSMLISMITASVIAFFVQDYSIGNIIKTLIIGFELPENNPLFSIIRGGGILSMLKLSLIVFMSSALTGIFEGANMLKFIEEPLKKIKRRDVLFLATTLTSIVSSMVGCTQVLAVMLTNITMKNIYNDNNVDKYKLAMDLENTAIVIAPLIPWNVAVLVPLTNLQIGPKAILFSFYCILLPITNFIVLYFKSKKNIKKSSSNIIEG